MNAAPMQNTAVGTDFDRLTGICLPVRQPSHKYVIYGDNTMCSNDARIETLERLVRDLQAEKTADRRRERLWKLFACTATTLALLLLPIGATRAQSGLTIEQRVAN